MTDAWAAKLSNVSASRNSTKPTASLPSKATETKSRKPNPAHSESVQHSTFNGKEILQYLSDSYNSHVQSAKEDKDGRTVKLYRSLESSSQWKTKSSTKIASPITNSPGTNAKSKYNSKTVIRNQRDSQGKANGNIDILFELNRSIYQQQQHQHANKK